MYDRFARYYDDFYAPLVDYAGDVAWLREAFERFARAPVKRVLDLGCGTGTHAAGLVDAGFDVVGVDVSEAMLEIARAKVPGARFERSDFTRALPEGRVDAACCMFAAFAYALEDADAGRALDLVRERLPVGGLFAFELWSPYGFRPQSGWTEAPLRDGRRIMRLTTPVFDVARDVYGFNAEILVLSGDRLDDRFVETHRLRLRTPAQTAALLARHGFEAAAFAQGSAQGKSWLPPGPDTFRVMCVARKA